MKEKKYSLIDSGNGMKLENVGGFRIIRPSQTSPYRPSHPELWENPDAVFSRNEKGGSWKFNKNIPEKMTLSISGSLNYLVKFTPFGHLGIFPEQESNWKKILHLGKEYRRELEVLNLFAYSGISTVHCLSAGFSVCHVDASKGMVEWAKENAYLSNLSDRKVRWIVDDVLKFLKREVKRGKKYQGFLLDPPTFGRGAKGEVWKLEEGLEELMDLTMKLCEYSPEFYQISSHTNGFSAGTMERILRGYISGDKDRFISEELCIEEESGERLFAGSSVFYSRKVRL